VCVCVCVSLYVCVCVCVRERERERERDTQDACVSGCTNKDCTKLISQNEVSNLFFGHDEIVLSEIISVF
jgi:hypothetical protein